jgi:hypothetical protein
MLNVIELLQGGDLDVNGGMGHVWIEIEFNSEKIELRLDECSDTLHFRRNNDTAATVYLPTEA